MDPRARKIIVWGSGVTMALWLCFAAWIAATNAAGIEQAAYSGAYSISGGQEVDVSDRTAIYGTPSETLTDVTFTIYNYGTATCADATNHANAYTTGSNPSDAVAVSIAPGETQDVTYTWTASSVQLQDVASWVPYATGADDMTGGGCLYKYLMSDADVLGSDSDTKAFGYTTKDYRIAINTGGFSDPSEAPDTTIVTPTDGGTASANFLAYDIRSSLGQWQVPGPLVGTFDIDIEISDGSGGYDPLRTVSVNWTGQYPGDFVGVTGTLAGTYPPNGYRMRARTQFIGYTVGAWSAWTEFTTSGGAFAVGSSGGGAWGSEDDLGKPSCSIIGDPEFGFSGASWTFAAGDGADCVWSWIKFVFVPPPAAAFYADIVGTDDDPTSGLVDSLLGMWPVYYLFDFYTEIQTVSASACPFPDIGGGTWLGATVPTFDLCDIFADLPGYVEGSLLETIGVAAVWLLLLVHVMRSIPRVMPFIHHK